MKLQKLIVEIVEESINVILKPSDLWQKVRDGKDSFSQVFRKFFVPSLIIIFAAVVVGDVLFNSMYGVLLKDALIKAGRKTLILIAILYSSMVVIYELARAFKLNPDFESSRYIAIYSMVPLVVITTITGLLPFLGFLGFLSLYAMVVAFFGIREMFEINKDKEIIYIATILFALLLNALFITYILNKLVAIFIY